VVKFRMGAEGVRVGHDPAVHGDLVLPPIRAPECIALGVLAVAAGRTPPPRLRLLPESSQVEASSFLSSNSRAALGSACPPESFMTSPTSRPTEAAFPARTSAAALSLAAIV
jgi:hypothetical protein